MRRPTIAYAQKGLPVQCLSERDFLYPDADEQYVPEVLAYIQSYDFKTFNTLLLTRTPEDVLRRSPICLTVKKASRVGRCSTSGASASRKGGGVCRRTSFNAVLSQGYF
jgi:hypothetical protein